MRHSLKGEGGVSIAELLNRLEKLEVKRDFDRLKRFVDEVASLLHNDQDNRELVQLHQVLCTVFISSIYLIVMSLRAR